MEFSPANPIVQLCLQGMRLEENGDSPQAALIFRQAWNNASNDFEKYLGAWFVAQQQKMAAEKFYWLEQALQHALRVDTPATTSALRRLYDQLANCSAQLQYDEAAVSYRAKAATIPIEPADNGPFYHGTKADLKPGDQLLPGRRSNYQSDLVMNHIYFTALVNGAGLAASLAKDDGEERVYEVKPTGAFEHDPNVTDKKFPGNPTRSYRTASALTVIAEIKDWKRQSEEQISEWKKKLADNNGKIIN